LAHGLDKYGRTLATRFLGAADLGRWLVAEGLATAYVADEDEARAARRGIWAGTFTMPEEWRHSRR